MDTVITKEEIPETTDQETPVPVEWSITHPVLDGPLVLESIWSERVTRHFGWKYLAANLPGFAEAVAPFDPELRCERVA